MKYQFWINTPLGDLHRFTGVSMRLLRGFYSKLIVVIRDEQAVVVEYNLSNVWVKIRETDVYLIAMYHPLISHQFRAIVMTQLDCERVYSFTKYYRGKLVGHSDNGMMFRPRSQLTEHDPTAFTFMIDPDS